MLPLVFSDIKDVENRRFMISLYEKYRNLIFHITKKWIDTPEEQDDISQEVWLKLVCKEELLKSLSEPKRASYIAYCARNTAFKRLRELNKERTKLVELDNASGEDIFVVAVPSSEEIAIQKEFQQEFQRIWELLPDRERMLIEGKYLFKESDEELAEWLGCKPSSVRMALTRAKRTAVNELMRRRNDEQLETTAGAV